MTNIAVLILNAIVQNLIIGVAGVGALLVLFSIWRTCSAAFRSAAWVIVILASVLFPIVWPLTGLVVHAASSPSALTVPLTAPKSDATSRSSPQTAALKRDVIGSRTGEQRVARAVVPTMPAQLLIAPSLAVVLAATWAAFCALFAVRLLILYGLLHAALRRMVIPDAGLHRRVRHALQSLGVRKRVYVSISQDDATPGVAGVVTPTIVLPNSVADESAPTEIECIIIHEAAHLIRNDHYFDLLTRIALVVAFFNPALWVARKQLELDREIACDDWVLQHGTPNRNGYARLLARIGAFPRLATGLTLASSANHLVKRVESVLTGKAARDLRSLPAFAICAALFAPVCALAMTLSLVTLRTPASAAYDPNVPQGIFDNRMVAGATLSLYSYNGTVSVEPTSGDHLTITAHSADGPAEKYPLFSFSGKLDPEVCALARKVRTSRCAGWNAADASDVTSVDWRVQLPAGRNIAIHTASGTVSARADGNVKVRSINGDINASGRIVDAITQHGSIDATYTAQAIPNWVTLDARDGNVAVSLPSVIRTGVVASSIHGKINASFPISIGKEPGYDWLIGRATLGGAAETQKLIIVAGGTITLTQR